MENVTVTLTLTPQIGNIKVCLPLNDWSTVSNAKHVTAGVGNDPRSSRQFNPIKQAADYDPSGDYVRLWIPELKIVPDNQVQTPWCKFVSIFPPLCPFSRSHDLIVVCFHFFFDYVFCIRLELIQITDSGG